MFNNNCCSEKQWNLSFCIHSVETIEESSHYNAQTIMLNKYFCVQLLLMSLCKISVEIFQTWISQKSGQLLGFKNRSKIWTISFQLFISN